MKRIETVLVSEVLKNKYDIDPASIRGIYEFGSIKYGTNSESSDRDYVVVVNMNKNRELHYESADVDIHFLSTFEFDRLLEEHDIMALECYFDKKPILEYHTKFNLELSKLRRKIAHIASNSWVKAKKKVNLTDEDSWIGYKSLFHSFRIPMFGIQIAKYGEIKDFAEANYIWSEIITMVDSGMSIEKIQNELKPKHNAMMSEFRRLAPKN